MGWMRTKFSLDDRQAETIARIHAEYENDCAQMCAKIAESDEQLAALLRSSQTITPEIQEAIIQTDRLRSECRSKMLAHFYRIAAELPAEKRSEYLEVVLPSVLRPGEMAQSPLALGVCAGTVENGGRAHRLIRSVVPWRLSAKILTSLPCPDCGTETIWP